MKKVFTILVLVSILSVIACDPTAGEKKKTEDKRIQDSIEYAKRILNNSSEQKESDLPLELMNDIELEVTKHYHYDKNEVRWGEKESTKFRFVYKEKLNKLLVYKNGDIYKTYQNPIVDMNFNNIYFNGTKIFEIEYSDVQPTYYYGPTGLNTNTEYFTLHDILGLP